MNIQIELRKALDWINLQEPIIRVLLWIAVLFFVIIPFGIPLAVIYFVWTIYKSREQTQ